MLTAALIFALIALSAFVGSFWGWLALLSLLSLPPGLLHLPLGVSPAVAGIVVALLRLHLMRSNVDTPKSRRSNPLLIAGLSSVAVVALATWTNERTPLTRAYLQLALLGCLAAVLVREARRRRAMERTTTALLALGALLAACAVYERMSGAYLFADTPGLFRVSERGGLRAQAWLQQPLILSLVLVICLTLVVAAQFNPFVKLALASLFVAGMYSTASRTCVVALAAAGALVVLRRARGRYLLPSALAVIAIVSAATPYVASTYVNPESAQTLAEVSVSYRVALVRAVLTDALHHPLGHGAGGLPRGAVYVDSTYGARDVAATIDNTFLFLLTVGGWLTLLFALLLVLRGFRDWRTMAAAQLGVRVALLVFSLSISIVSFAFSIALFSVVTALSGRHEPREGADLSADSLTPSAASARRPLRQTRASMV